MTDSIHISLDLSHLPLDARQQIPLALGTTKDQDGVIYAHGPRPLTVFSPLSGTKFKFIVRGEKVTLMSLDGPKTVDVARSIDADLSIPNAVCGQNLEHGTSVLAAGIAGLWLLKIWLAENGLGRKYLDLLDTSCITLLSVTLTYLMRLMSPDAARQFVRDVRITAEILNRRAKVFSSSNETVSMPTKSGWLVAYWKTVFDHCKFPEDAPTQGFQDSNACTARLESVLAGAFLRREGLDTLESWRDAYSNGLYEKLFQRTIRDPLRLNLRHKHPREQVRSLLSPTEREFLDWYLSGQEPRQFCAVAQSKYPASTYSKLRRPILDNCDIETNITWSDHAALRCYKLKYALVYPGDYCPAVERSPWCFCRENWPALLQRLREDCERAIWRSPENFATATPQGL